MTEIHKQYLLTRELENVPDPGGMICNSKADAEVALGGPVHCAAVHGWNDIVRFTWELEPQ